MEIETCPRAVPVIDTDPFDQDILLDPYPFYETLFDTGPIVWLSEHECYGVARFDAVKSVFEDWQNFISSGGAGLSDIRKPGAWRDPGPIVEVDPPRHTQIRKVMSRIISPKVIKGWEDTFRAEAQYLCDAILHGPDELDGVTDLAEAYVLTVFPQALGIDVDKEHLITVGNHNFNAIGPQNALFRQSEAELEEISDWFERSQKRDALIPGGFGELIFDAENRGDLPQGTASPMLRTFLRGGMDTTISGLASTLRVLAEKPDLWQSVKSEPASIANIFEEAVRLESPIRTLFRTTASHPVEFEGHVLEPDTKVQLFPGAANRDPRKWIHPNEFDRSRKLGLHSAFGLGIHNCLGRLIAHLEAQCLISALSERLKSIEIVGQPRIRLNNALRTLDTLPLRITRE